MLLPPLRIRDNVVSEKLVIITLMHSILVTRVKKFSYLAFVYVIQEVAGHFQQLQQQRELRN